MNNWRFFQPVDSMEQIPMAALGSQMETLLKRCDTENIGFVIQNGDKQYVLCPAHWFYYCFDDDFGCVINAALRYAMHRHTYIPSVVAGFIRKYLGVLDTKTLTVICEDIEKDLTYMGGPDDPDMWQKLLEDCKATLVQKLMEVGK